ncbi:type II secretion system minor pseudopilin GspI [Telmatocola sphagniphila]|uniref:Type II secretion system protein I n=1 Tax=Telmatocola sphagniphila TaxID=1123043 RepID=A0A8E6EX06_9BACT|nr:type II secretion system minor pseudopilin GspI [Telmatocola sphagniphila]QVL34372.1 type II secretion system minor pseudopilin GspI [Telmatocola sphagniphila]
MILQTTRTRRSGLTLLEVIIAFAIFLMSIIALYKLMGNATDSAIEIESQSKATRLIESKMAEFISGVQPLSGGGGGSFDDEDGWSWSADISPASLTNLYQVTITVTKDGSDNAIFPAASMTQYIFDPTMRGGSPMITQIDTSTSSSTSSSSSSSSSGTGSSGSGSSSSSSMGNSSSSKGGTGSSSSKGGN